MDRQKLIERLESDDFVTGEDDASTAPAAGSSEAMRMAVSKIREKRTRDGKVIGVGWIRQED
jgi:hypothetical protein